MKKTTFRSRFFFYFFVGAAVSIVITYIILFAFVSPNLYEREKLTHVDRLNSISGQVEQFLNYRSYQADTLGNIMNSTVTVGKINDFLKEKTKNLDDIAGVLAFNNKGYSYSNNIELSVDEARSKIQDKNKPMFFEKELKGTYNNLIFLSTPAQIAGGKGYIIFQIKNSSLQRLLDTNGRQETLIIQGADGKTIASNYGFNGMEEDLKIINAKYNALNSNVIDYSDSVGAKKVAVVKGVYETGWRIYSVSNWKEFYNVAESTQSRVMWVIAVYTFLSLVIISVISNFLLRPLNKLNSGVQAVESGDLNYKISFSPKDVFSEVVEGFNKMVGALKHNYEELQKKTEELYERNWQVEEANRELEESYQKLQETINQLNEAEEKYYALVKNIPEVVCVIEFDGTITFVNDHINDMLGYKKEEIVGQSIDLFINDETSKKLLNLMNKKLKKDNKIIVEIPMVKKDGTPIITEAKLTHYLRNGNPDGVQAIVRDITKTKKMQNEIMRKNEELITIYNISKSISSTIELDSVFKLIVDEVCKILGAEMCLLRLFDYTQKNLVLRAYSGSFFDKISNDELHQFLILPRERVEDIIKSKKFEQYDSFDSGWLFDTVNSKSSENEKISQVTIVPICSKDNVLGIITIGTKNKVSEKRTNILTSIANNAAIAIDNATLYENSKKYFIKTIDALIAAVEAKDKYTEGHSQRVSKYCVLIAQHMGLSKERVEDLKIAGILHDVGKIGISDRILSKPGKLTPEEYEEIKQHPIISNRILYSVGLSEVTMKAIACHHERYDGKGYPFGLKGEELTIECQIIAVADSFDAMTSTRAYRKALTVDEAINEIVKNKGAQFGPLVADAMKELFDNDYEKIAAIAGEIGIAS